MKVNIAGLAAVYDSADLNRDTFYVGAFASSRWRDPGSIPMLYEHNARRPIGRWTSFTETAVGMFVRGEIIDPVMQRHVLDGAITGLSVGFRAKRSQRDETGRLIIAADLYEISLCDAPMHPRARILRSSIPLDGPPIVMTAEAAGVIEGRQEAS